MRVLAAETIEIIVLGIGVLLLFFWAEHNKALTRSENEEQEQPFRH